MSLGFSSRWWWGSQATLRRQENALRFMSYAAVFLSGREACAKKLHNNLDGVTSGSHEYFTEQHEYHAMINFSTLFPVPHTQSIRPHF